ncbi:MAG: penicillin-binding protein 2 [Candidatus Eremiobacterota bacterium]
MNNRSDFIFKIIILLIFTGLSVRLFQLQIIKGNELLKKAEKNIVRRTYTKAQRGLIYDRNGQIMSNNKPSFLLTINPTELVNEEKTFSTLEKILAISKKDIKEKIEFSPYPLFTPVEIKHDLTLQTVAELSEILSSLPGVYIETEPIRNYPGSNLASHVIGYVGLPTDEELEDVKEQNYQPWEIIGKDGIELYYNSTLRGKQGIKEIEVNAEGNIVKVLGETIPISGNNIYLTIDKDLQRAAEEELEMMLQRLSFAKGKTKAGTVTVISVKTGDILAMTSKPDYNPNLFSTGISEKNYKQLIENPWKPLFNRTISGLYPPASTFKIITSAAALQEKIVGEWTPFYCAGYIKVEDKIFNCDLRTGHGKIDFTNAIAESCDVVFYELGMKLGLKKIEEYAKEFNLGIATGVELPGENPGLLPTEKWKEKTIGEKWYIGDTVNMSIGQGYLLVTPLQMAVVTAILAGNGDYNPPHLVKKIASEQGDIIYEYKAKNHRKMNVSEYNLNVIKNGMRMAVTSGTSTAGNIKGIEISGKTGTAENFPTPENPTGENHVWFVAFAPSDDPEIAISVFLEQAGGYAGKSAVPLGTEVIKDYFDIKKKRMEKKVNGE